MRVTENLPQMWVWQKLDEKKRLDVERVDRFDVKQEACMHTKFKQTHCGVSKIKVAEFLLKLQLIWE